ncbi:hypothetical protein TRVL_04291 [Trypanosoma vivax]|nr:hypothetical protein TRVL_04291 [Trypanosoma vivax]
MAEAVEARVDSRRRGGGLGAALATAKEEKAAAASREEKGKHETLLSETFGLRLVVRSSFCEKGEGAHGKGLVRLRDDVGRGGGRSGDWGHRSGNTVSQRVGAAGGARDCAEQDNQRSSSRGARKLNGTAEHESTGRHTRVTPGSGSRGVGSRNTQRSLRLLSSFGGRSQRNAVHFEDEGQ